MRELFTTKISTDHGNKELSVFCGDIFDFGREIDILTTSAYVGSYAPTPNTIFNALHEHGISASSLASAPEIDLRAPCYTWLSKEIEEKGSNIHRIGCVELIGNISRYDYSTMEQSMINTISAYFAMLDIAAIYNVKMETIVLPLLGSGNQHISSNLMIVPLLNECISFLKRNAEVKRICFVEKNEKKANLISSYIQQSYNVFAQSSDSKEEKREIAAMSSVKAFISYSSKDREVADKLCEVLEKRGVQVWYAPRNVKGAYAESITRAIEDADHFIVILSENSMQSQHVLNEIDLAFQRYPANIRINPLRVDKSEFTPSFRYYLSRQHWKDAFEPPLRDRLSEFADDLLYEYRSGGERAFGNDCQPSSKDNKKKSGGFITKLFGKK